MSTTLCLVELDGLGGGPDTSNGSVLWRQKGFELDKSGLGRGGTLCRCGSLLDFERLCFRGHQFDAFSRAVATLI